jgi:RNA polymerase sigma-70 factor (ECF subfamily)
VEPASDALAAYRRYAPALLRKAERILGNRDDAADVVQALFADLVDDGARSFELAYLYRAVTNRCLNLVRDTGTRSRLLAGAEPALAPPRVDCDGRVIGLDLVTKLQRSLDARHMEVLVARFVDDMGQEEIASLMGISRKTVQKRLDRIRRAVAEVAAEPEPAR